MDWNRVEGNWKQVKGKVKESGANSQTTISTWSPASATSSKARSRSATAWRAIRSEGHRRLVRLPEVVKLFLR